MFHITPTQSEKSLECWVRNDFLESCEPKYESVECSQEKTGLSSYNDMKSCCSSEYKNSKSERCLTRSKVYVCYVNNDYQQTCTTRPTAQCQLDLGSAQYQTRFQCCKNTGMFYYFFLLN